MAHTKIFIVVCILSFIVAADSKNRVKKKCGLPSFHDKLPADAKEKVTNIWANYTAGHSCKKELKLQRAIVDSLDNATKEELFNGSTAFNRKPPICGLPHFIDDLPTEAQKELRSIWTDYKDGIECEDMQNATKHLIDALPADIRQKLTANSKRALALAKLAPAFLKNLDQETRQKFHEIFLNKDLDKHGRRAVLKKLAESVLTKEQLQLFYKYLAKRDARGARTRVVKGRRSRIAGTKTKDVPINVATDSQNATNQLNTTADNSTVGENEKKGRKNSTLQEDHVDSRRNGSRHVAPRCGIPPYQQKLPNDAQEKVRTIWAKYVQGDDCKKERKAMRDLIKTLPKDVRLSLRPKKGKRGEFRSAATKKK